MAEPFLTEIRPVPFNFAPVGWAACNGQILPISQNTAVFSLLGTNFGGDGRSNFALPNLQGRIPIGSGQAPGLSNRVLGEIGGDTTVTLSVAQIPGHNHVAAAISSPATSYSPVGNLPATAPREVYGLISSGPAATGMVQPSGGNEPHNNLQPYLVINFVIALAGIFPERP